MASFAETAPQILTDIDAARGFVRSLDRASDLMEAACSAAVLVLLVLDAHLDREGKDNHASALLETAQWLHSCSRCGRPSRSEMRPVGEACAAA